MGALFHSQTCDGRLRAGSTNSRAPPSTAPAGQTEDDPPVTKERPLTDAARRRRLVFNRRLLSSRSAREAERGGDTARSPPVRERASPRASAAFFYVFAA